MWILNLCFTHYKRCIWKWRKSAQWGTVTVIEWATEAEAIGE